MSAGMKTDRLRSPADRAAIEAEWADEKPDRLLTCADLSARWQIPKSQVYRLAREGQLPVVALCPRYRRFSLTAIAEFEKAGGTEGKK